MRQDFSWSDMCLWVSKILNGLTLISKVLNISVEGNIKKGSKFANKGGQAWN